MNKNNNYIWLIGENVGETANNNSFYFWKHIVNNHDGIDKYFVISKNERNKRVYETLSPKEKQYIIWRNSIQHFLIYRNADMYFVTLSYRDIRPEKFLNKNYEYKIRKPVVYLQHGTLGMKRVNYGSKTYNNNLFRFLYYNENIKNDLIELNGFRDYQLYYGEFHPRYQELVKRQRAFKNESKNQILWFLTWREYKDTSIQSKIFIKTINGVLKNKTLAEYLKRTNTKLKLCLHQLYEVQKDSFMKDVECDNIEIAYANQTDIMQEMVESKMLITDYSSVGFDFTMLNKPVILFQPDLEDYMEVREFYCTTEEMKENNIESSRELIEKIISEKYEVNKFFRTRIKKDIDYDYLAEGKHIDRIYEYFKKIQENKITFIGYNFHGVGGTVSATRSLAEGLMEKGYMVQLLSLKVVGKARRLPSALNTQYIYHEKGKRFVGERIRRRIYSKKKSYKYLINDANKIYIKPFAGHDLEKILSKIRSNTVVSTRESLHLFLKEATSEKIKNKIYFFHCAAELVPQLFPGMIEKLKKVKLEKAVFVTEKNKVEYKEKLGYDNYENSLVIGNALEKTSEIEFDEIEGIEQKDKYYGIYLLRVSKDRVEDVNNVIGFGRYLKENNIKNIVIDVYGDGDYADQFIDLLINEELMDYIHYKGKTLDPTQCIREHDALIDFSKNHSFGMTYIEGILNGRKVYCMKNTGSMEVMGDIPNTYIESYEDLVNKINNLPNVTKEELQDNYKKIQEKYSRNIVSKKFIEYLN